MTPDEPLSHDTDHGGGLPDIAGPGMRLLLVGINPGLRSAALGQHFAGRSNRFWPALHAAGITPTRLDPAEQWRLVELGVGLTNLVARPSAGAGEVTPDELRAGAGHLTAKVSRWRPAAVAVLGVTAFRVAFDLPAARVGPRGEDALGVEWHVLHNPSGLNAHATPAGHAAGLREVARVAGLLP